MNNVLEYLYNHPRETKRIIGITDKQLIKLIENTQKIEEKKRQAIPSKEKILIKAGGGRKKNLKSRGRNHLNFMLFTSYAHICSY